MEWKNLTYLAASGARMRFRVPADWKAEYEPPDPNPEDPDGDYLSFYPPEDVLRWGSHGHFWLMARPIVGNQNADAAAVEAVACHNAVFLRDKLASFESLSGGRYLRKSKHQFYHPLERRQEVHCSWELIQPMPEATYYAYFGFGGEAACYDPADGKPSTHTALLNAIENEFRAAVFLP